MKKVILLAFSVSFFYNKIISQQIQQNHIGTVAIFYTSFKPSLYLGYTYQKKQLSLSVRIIGFADDRKANVDNDFPIQKYLDFGILAGWSILQNNTIEISLHSGISYISAMKQGDFIKEEYGWTGTKYRYYEEKKVSNIGFPIEMKVIFPLSKMIGITTMGYANLNGKINTTGIGLGVVFKR